jgi:hypothetical protein
MVRLSPFKRIHFKEIAYCQMLDHARGSFSTRWTLFGTGGERQKPYQAVRIAVSSAIMPQSKLGIGTLLLRRVVTEITAGLVM